MNWFISIFLNDNNISNEAKIISEYKEKESLINKVQSKPIGEETVNMIFDKIGFNPNKIKEIQLFGFGRDDDNISQNQKDGFVPIGDELVNKIIKRLNFLDNGNNSEE